MQLQLNRSNLEERTNSLKSAGEWFETQVLNSPDRYSTITSVQNSISSHERANLIHNEFGKFLINSSNLILDIGDKFFEADEMYSKKMDIGAMGGMK